MAIRAVTLSVDQAKGILHDAGLQLQRGDSEAPDDAYVVTSSEIDALLTLIEHGYKVSRTKTYLRIVGPEAETP